MLKGREFLVGVKRGQYLLLGGELLVGVKRDSASSIRMESP